MAEEEHKGGGVTIKTGEKSVGTQALETAPVVGNAVKAADAASKVFDGDASGSDVQGLLSEGSGVIQSAAGAAMGVATDPLGWLVGQGLNFLITVVQPIQDAIHFVSGDGPALSQAAENFNEIAKGVTKLRETFDSDLATSLSNWGGDAAQTAGTKLGDFSKGIDGVAGQAGEVAEMLQMSSMVMTVIEDFIKALLTEFITWLIMIWIPALAAAVPTAGASTATAGTLTAARAATTGGKVTRMVAKLRNLLDSIMAFLRRLGSRMGNLRQGLKTAMDNKRMRSGLADLEVQDATRSPLSKPMAKLNSADGMVGERVQKGFGSMMGKTLADTAAAQVGAGTGANAGVDKYLRNTGNQQKASEYDQAGSEASVEETEGNLDI